MSNLYRTFPDKAENDHQRSLQEKHGTPAEFARALQNACGEISIVEAEVAMDKYLGEWLGGGQVPVSPTTPLFKPSFRVWLGERVSREDAVGTLARDALGDKSWIGDSPTSLKQHLYASIRPRRLQEVLLWFCEAVDEWYTVVDKKG